MTETLQIRLYGDPSLPTLIYLPGLHGDWTLVGSFRKAISGRVRFVEFTYPRTLVWSLDQYAEAIEMKLREHGVSRGWLLGESFGSQVAWALAERKGLAVEGLILAGGFVRHPIQWAVRTAERVAGRVSLRLLTRVIFGYAKVARFRYRNSPETLGSIQEFIERRTELDRQAATHRLHLVAMSDPRRTARSLTVPLFAISGAVDPIVPWPLVRRWLQRNCDKLGEFKVIWNADHNVLGTAPEAAADQVAQWMNRR